ncbi:tnf receptor-associated factor [Plakobranchus ocellatus]|uniref:Tnf receptor-associated factor n=1 Tax=Plakobranchus ocellatus TaxID=259542 RepID=A0AAV3YHB1_9GAST|nr:tnf receptor-associated factor [Plakobranchus ocellatus]
MSQRPLALCRSLSDSGFGVTTGESDSNYYNTLMFPRQNSRAGVRNKLRPGFDGSPHDVALRWERVYSAQETKAYVVNHSLGTLDMVLECISRELESPLDSNSDGLFNTPPPSYNSLTEEKSIASCGDAPHVDITSVKAFCSETGDQEVEPNSADDERLSDDDRHHLVRSVEELRKNLDLLHSKLDGLLEQKPDKRTLGDYRTLHLKESSGLQDEFIAKRTVNATARENLRERNFSKESIYVQIEHEYYNLQRMRFLYPHVGRFFKGFSPFPTAAMASAKAPPPPPTETASTQTNSDPADDVESLKKKYSDLQKENASLRVEVQALKQLISRKSTVPRQKPGMRVKAASLSDDDRCSAPLYTVVNCTAGRPTTPPPRPPVRKEIQITEVTYEWTIHDYNRQFQEQKSGECLKTTSPPFFITHNGYRACMEAYLDGDGDAKGSYLSVFLRILPGDRDHQLSWPAHLKLSFILVNQTGEGKESIKTFVEHVFPRPSKNGNSSCGNDCWGVIDLASHDLICSKHFIFRDKLLLKCRVHILSD